MNKPIFHFLTRAYDDELSEGLHLAGYDVSDRETGEVFFISRTYYGNPEKVFNAAQNDLKCKAAGSGSTAHGLTGKACISNC